MAPARLQWFPALHRWPPPGYPADRPAKEFIDDRQQQLTVHIIKAFGIHVEHIQRLSGNLLRDTPVVANLGKVTHPAQQTVGDSRRTARAARDLQSPSSLISSPI